MEKSPKKRKITKKQFIAAGAAVFAAALFSAVLLLLLGSGKSGKVRELSVSEVSADTQIVRGGNVFGADSGTALQSGDTLKVGSGGFACLNADGNMHIFLEENTEAVIEASGDAQNSRTVIRLERGAVLNEIDGILNAGSSYEVYTPDSVMTAQGTVFRASYGSGTDGAPKTGLMVFGGTVGCRLRRADGALTEEEVPVEAGKAAVFWRSEAEEDTVYEQCGMEFESIPRYMQEILDKMGEEGKISPLWEESGPEDSPSLKTEEPASGTFAPSADPSPTSPGGIPAPSSLRPDASPDTGENGRNPLFTLAPGLFDDIFPTSTPSQTAKTPRPAKTAKPPRTTAPPKTPKPLKTPKPTKTSAPEKTPAPAKTAEPNQGICTITFVDADGQVFATQQVRSGESAMRPSLSPINGTDWHDAQGNVYDFETVVCGDMTLYYK